MVLNFTVGILTPDWLANATYLGREHMNGVECHKWTKAAFIDYWASTETGNPVKWVFLWDGASFDVTSFKVNATVPKTSYWQAPPSCFKQTDSAII